jgi:hypothetical protein
LGTGIVEPSPTAQALVDIGHSKIKELEIITDA